MGQRRWLEATGSRSYKNSRAQCQQDQPSDPVISHAEGNDHRTQDEDEKCEPEEGK